VVGIFVAILLIIVGAVIAKKRWVLQKKRPNLKTLESLIEEDPLVDLFDRKFPQSTVKAWKDITLERKLGSGQFGKVYKGFLHLGKYTR
jgi:hypothetical protein